MGISEPQAGKAIECRGQSLKGLSCGNLEKENSVRNMDNVGLTHEL